MFLTFVKISLFLLECPPRILGDLTWGLKKNPPIVQLVIVNCYHPSLALVLIAIHLLSYYLANKWSLHVCSQGLEILTLIEEKRKK